MITVNVSERERRAAFAEKAAVYFSECPSSYIYTDGNDDPEAGELLAIRCNQMAVIVVRLHDEAPVEVYPVWQFLSCDLPPLKGEA